MKKKKSFMLSFFLAMLFVVLGSVNVKADETLEGYIYVNPMYEDLEGNFDFESDFELYSESDSEESDEEDGIDTYDSRSVQYTSDKQSLIKTFRQQLVNRAGTIDLSLLNCLMGQRHIRVQEKREIISDGTTRDGVSMQIIKRTAMVDTI